MFLCQTIRLSSQSTKSKGKPYDKLLLSRDVVLKNLQELDRPVEVVGEDQSATVTGNAGEQNLVMEVGTEEVQVPPRRRNRARMPSTHLTNYDTNW